MFQRNVGSRPSAERRTSSWCSKLPPPQVLINGNSRSLKRSTVCTEIAKHGYPGVQIDGEAVARRIGRIDEEIA